jgi:hypothetical protein
MEKRRVLITVALESDDVAEQLARLCKRATFEMYYRLTESHLPADERARRAELMVSGVTAISDALARAGHDPIA